ncbi:hypothetical protein WJX74_010376 [Apatococcus lobatus]|uniref:Uncharacterized protein n=1 Tax=Apatococcus lobatus TaxID=904363 RepID=A0AAW1S2Z7_9CHLO
MKTLSPLRCYDFQGHGWHSAFTIEEVVESMTDILPEPGQLRGWLDNLEDPVLQTNSTTGSSIEATVHLNPSGTVQIRLPPSGTLKDGREKKLQHIYSVVGFGLFEAYKGQVPSSPREVGVFEAREVSAPLQALGMISQAAPSEPHLSQANLMGLAPAQVCRLAALLTAAKQVHTAALGNLELSMAG